MEEEQKEEQKFTKKVKKRYVRTQISEKVAKYLAKKLKSNIILISPCGLDYLTISCATKSNLILAIDPDPLIILKN